MNDFEQTLLAKSDQVNNTDLIGSDLTITITKIKVNTKEDQPVSISFAESEDKSYRPCKGMRRLMAQIWGINYQDYVGRKLTLYRDASVRFGAAGELGGIRISHMSHMNGEKTVTVPISRGKVKSYVVQPLQVSARPPAAAPQALPTEPALDTAIALAIATAAAKKGAAHFRAWFNTDEGKAARATGALSPEEMLKLKAVATTADDARTEDPFGLPPIDHEAEARAFAEAQAREAGAV